MKRLCFLVLVLAIMAGCTFSKPYVRYYTDMPADKQQELKAQHPEYNWTRICEHRIAKGMTKEEVLLSWGKPTRKHESTWGSRWVYKHSHPRSRHLRMQIIYFSHGYVDGWSKIE